MTPTPRRDKRPNRAVTILLGILVLVTSTGSFLLASTSAPAHLTNVDVAPLIEQSTPTLPGDESVGTDEAMSLLAATGAVAATGCSLENPGACRGEPWNGAFDVDDLPAWRWRSVELDVDTTGGIFNIQGSFKAFPAMIAEFFYLFAQWLWLIVLGVMKLGFDSKVLITVGTESINSGAAFMADKMLYFAIPIAGLVAWRFVKEFVKLKAGLVTGAFRSFVVFAVSFGLIYMIVDRSNYAITNFKGDRDAQLEVSGTIPWMAREVLDIVDTFTGPITDPVLKINTDDGDEKGLDAEIAGSSGTNPEDGDLTVRGAGSEAVGAGDATCRAYIETIYGAYASGPSPEKTLIVVSRLWESTLYESWKGGAFGNPVTFDSANGPYASDIPDRVMCHFAESETGTSVEEQQRIAHIAYDGGIREYTGTAQVPTVFGPFDATNNKDERKAMSAWAACKLDGSTWTGQVEFDGAWAESGDENPFDALCAGVMNGTEGFGDDEPFYVFSGKGRDATAKGDSVHREQLRAAREYAIAYGGGSPGVRIMGGLISLLVAIAFIITFGFLGLGLLVAMMLAVVFLALALPAAIFLAAIGRTKQAQPLFRMTMLSLLSHGLLTVILSLIIIISGVFRALLSNLTPGGFIGALVSGLAPVGAFVAVRKVLKSLGMADIMSPSGAIGFAGAAALKAGGNGFTSLGKSIADGKGMHKLPGVGKKLEKMDRFAPNKPSNWTWRGRQQRTSEAAKEDAAEAKFRQERIASRMKKSGNAPGRVARMRNRIDRARIPGTARDNLKGVADRASDGLKAGAKAGADRTGITAAAGMVGRARDKAGAMLEGAALEHLGTVGIGLVLAKKRFGRGPGEAVDEDEAIEMGYGKGAIRRGRDAGEYRTEAVQNARNVVSAGIDDAEARLRNNNPGGLDDDALRAAAEKEGLRKVVEGVFGDWAEQLTGSRRLLTEAERDGLRISAGREEGYPPRMMIATAAGVVLPMPYEGQRKRKDLTDEQLGHPVHWLPAEDKERRMVPWTDGDGRHQSRPETESEYGARLLATCVARGVASPDGSFVDVLSLKGIDVTSKEGRKIVAEWRSGQSNEILDTLKIVGTDPGLEKKLVTAAVEVSRQQEMQVHISQVNASIAQESARMEESRRNAEAWKQGKPTGPSQSSQEAGKLADGVSQLLVAVNAAKDLFDKAKTKGDPSAMNAAAQRMSVTLQKLEENQERLVDGIANSMTESLEKQLIAQSERDTKFAENFERSFGEGIDRIETTVAAVNKVLEDFKNNTIGLQTAIANLSHLVQSERTESADANAKLQETLATIERSVKTTGAGKAGDTVRGTPNSRDVAEATGATAIPRDENPGKKRT